MFEKSDAVAHSGKHRLMMIALLVNFQSTFGLSKMPLKRHISYSWPVPKQLILKMPHGVTSQMSFQEKSYKQLE